MDNIDKNKLHPSGTIEQQYREMEQDLSYYWDKSNVCLNKDKVKHVLCSLCNSDNDPKDSEIFSKFGFPYVMCKTCSLVYPNPRPKTEFIEEQYVNGRFSKSFADIYLPSSEYRMKTIFKERVEEIIMPRVNSGSILDIGCSSGHFLKVAYDHGFEVHGIEPNPKMVEYSTKELGLPNIHNGTTDNIELGENTFDVVTLWDVIEHVEDPSSLLSYAFKVLKPRGWVFAYTENFNSFNYFITGELSEMFGADVHLRHYTPKTFRCEFENAGFTVREVLTKGLDVQHIETITKVYKDKFLDIDLQFLFNNKESMQEVINAAGKGDNLRLFAQK
jgi:2-polyprenyl-3-methyl-5-hydroxy-6-metoxy-1,4-benzoquinol methylase